MHAKILKLTKTSVSTEESRLQISSSPPTKLLTISPALAAFRMHGDRAHAALAYLINPINLLGIYHHHIFQALNCLFYFQIKMTTKIFGWHLGLVCIWFFQIQWKKQRNKTKETHPSYCIKSEPVFKLKIQKPWPTTTTNPTTFSEKTNFQNIFNQSDLSLTKKQKQVKKKS